MHSPLLQAISHAIQQIVTALGIILLLGLTAVYMASLLKGQRVANGKDAIGRTPRVGALDRFMNCVGRLLQLRCRLRAEISSEDCPLHLQQC
jgi:hypothetical protein